MPRLSTRDLSTLPDVPALRRLLQSLAMLDAILMPEWEDRAFSFDGRWGEGEALGSWRDGSGDELKVWFGPAGCWVKGFAHEAAMSPFREDPPKPWPGVLDAVPPEFAACLAEPAFMIEEVTFCLWRRPGDAAWQIGPVAFPKKGADPDGSVAILAPLDGKPKTYVKLAEDVFEVELDVAAVARVFAHEPLTEALLEELGEREVDDQLLEDLAEIGYPSALE